MNQEPNQAKIDEIILFFAEYTDAKEELERAEKFSSPRMGGPDNGKNPRLESAQQRFDSVLAKLPTRGEAEAAALYEFNTMISEFSRLKSAYKAAVEEELKAVIARDAANQTDQYRQRFAILGLDEITTTRAAHAAQENLNKVIYARQVTEDRMDRTYKRSLDEYTDPRAAGSFEPAARHRVEVLLGEHYAAVEVADLKAKLGLSDSILRRLAIP